MEIGLKLHYKVYPKNYTSTINFTAMPYVLLLVSVLLIKWYSGKFVCSHNSTSLQEYGGVCMAWQ